MHHPAVDMIRDEHEAFAFVLRALRDAVDSSGKCGVPPDFELLRAMLFYMDEMPARLHHAAEEELQFPRIRERCPPLRPVLDRLQAEHARGESTVQSLERALTSASRRGRALVATMQLSISSSAVSACATFGRV